MNILGFHNETGSKHWRLDQIANYVNALTEHEMFIASHKDWNDDTLGANVVVAELWRNPKAVDVCHRQGAKVVYEADDAMIGIGEERPELMQLTSKEAQQTIETIQKSDLVTVTTQPLAEHYAQWNKNVIVLPNYLDFKWWGEPPTVKKYGGIIRLGWAGSMSHESDLQFIKPVIKRVLEEFPFVKFVYCGHGGRTNLVGNDIFSDLPSSQREYIAGVSSEFWPAKSKTLGFDIGIAPLINDAFNSTKSAIKYMEYSANLVPGIYQDSIVYNQVVRSNITGLFASSADQWFEAISRLVLDEALRKNIAKDALKDVFTHHNLEDHYQEWIKAYQTIL